MSPGRFQSVVEYQALMEEFPVPSISMDIPWQPVSYCRGRHMWHSVGLHPVAGYLVCPPKRSSHTTAYLTSSV